MKILGRFFCIMVLLAGLWPVTPAAAVALGQIDTFEDGTNQGWLVGLLGAAHPAPPVNVANGGPAGAGDNYLLLTSVGGNGPGSKLAVLNLAQWAGDYLTAGVHGIRMDVNNLGNTELRLRLLVADPVAGPPTNSAFSTVAILVPAGSGWQTVIFPLSPGDLTPVEPDDSVVAALEKATELRIFHNPDPGFPGPSIAALMGVDNITAVPVPATLLLLGSGLLALVAGRKKF